MAAKARQTKTSRSTPRLSDVARELVIPRGIVTTAWPRVAAKCSELGVDFDNWQNGIGAVALGKRRNGKYAATVGGIVLSIPRQVGKTFLVGMIMIAMCLIFENYTVLWTAHHTRTTTKTFKTLQSLVRRPKIWTHVKAVRTANGEQEIRFKNGSVIMFGAREYGFGRGFDEVDAEVFDEAQILSARALDDMVPAANQARHPSGALLFFMGTPPRPGIDPGGEFTDRRTKALSGKAKDMLYVELSADPDANPDDRKQWAKANPSYPKRTPLESMQRMREQLPDLDSFKREGLGIWPVRSTRPPVIDPNEWAALVGPPVYDGNVAYGVRFSPDGARVTLAAAVDDAGRRFVEVIDSGSATSSMEGLTRWLAARWRDCDSIVIDGRGAADVLEERLVEAGVISRKITRPNMNQAAAAYAGLPDLVDSGRVVHAGQPGLAASIACSGKRDIGRQGAWGYESVTPTGDSTPTEAVALAISGLRMRKHRPPRGSTNGRARSGRKAVVL